MTLKEFIIGTIIFLITIFCINECLKPYNEEREKTHIHTLSLNGKNAVVIKKYMVKGAYGDYDLRMKVHINDSIKELDFVTPEIYEHYNVGDTIKHIGMKYE